MNTNRTAPAVKSLKSEMSFLEVVKSRKSCRRFASTPIPRDLIEKVLVLATYAPTNCNQQLWQFVVITENKIKQRLVNEAATSTIVSRAPVAIAVSYDGWNNKEAIQGGAIAVQNILLAATYYGLGCLSMNSYGNDQKVAEILHLPANQKICCFVLLGYPSKDEEAGTAVDRRPLRDAIHYNEFQGKVKPALQYDPETWSMQDLIDYQKYYCRKTFLGKEMDIMHDYEREIIRRTLAKVSGKVLDLLSYDGCYLKEFPNTALTTADLCRETALYTAAAAKASKKKALHTVLDVSKPKEIKDKYDVVTINYKFERLSTLLQQALLQTAAEALTTNGELIIISRRTNPFLNTFLYVIKKLFGDDIRKTGIYAFFGGYKPLELSKTRLLLKESGFKVTEASTYFALPAFFDQALQMYLQYKASAGTSYLHRIRRENILTRTLSVLLKLQGFCRIPSGSVVVIRARRLA